MAGRRRVVRHPRVYVAAEIADMLDEEQVTSVVTHEAAHLARARRDAAMRGGAPSSATHDHCTHHHRLALSHLFCLGAGSYAAGRPCPHSALLQRESVAPTS